MYYLPNMYKSNCGICLFFMSLYKSANSSRKLGLGYIVMHSQFHIMFTESKIMNIKVVCLFIYTNYAPDCISTHKGKRLKELLVVKDTPWFVHAYIAVDIGDGHISLIFMYILFSELIFNTIIYVISILILYSN